MAQVEALERSQHLLGHFVSFMTAPISAPAAGNMSATNLFSSLWLLLAHSFRSLPSVRHHHEQPLIPRFATTSEGISFTQR
jgi:hypothetical protein